MPPPPKPRIFLSYGHDSAEHRSQVKEADRVLLVFTETYQRRFEGDEEEGKGLEATFEGTIATQTLYETICSKIWRGSDIDRCQQCQISEQDISNESIRGTCHVFIDYSHDSPEHRHRVLALSQE